MQVDGRINIKDDQGTSDGEAHAGGHNMVPTTHAHSLLLPYNFASFLLYKCCGFVVFAIMHCARV